MKKLTVPPRVFHYQSQPVRTALIDGEAWFVAKDVCQVLGIANSRAALVSLDDDEKASVGIPDTSSSSRRSSLCSSLACSRFAAWRDFSASRIRSCSAA